MDLDFRGRVFLFSALRIFQRQSAFDFTALGGPIDYAEAIRQLVNAK